MTISISIWSDIACPWCFVGKARLESALDALANENEAPEVHIRWRAFELDPRPREKTKVPYAERLASKYNISVAEAQKRMDGMAESILSAGGECDFSRLIPANTFDAHRLIQWAGATDTKATPGNQQHRLTDALMRGYLGRGLDLNSHAALLELVADVGLDTAFATEVLAGNEYGQTVRADEQEAQAQGIQGVPFFVIGRYGVSGAQAAQTFVDVIKQIQAEQETGYLAT